MEERKREIKVKALVVDTNIVISALIPKNSKLRDIIFSGELELYAPVYPLKELEKFWNIILTKAEKKGIDKVNVELVKEELISEIFFVSEKHYSSKIKSAYEICKKFDEKDAHFVALSLAFNLPILTQDKGIIENAGKYEVLTIKELINY